MTKQSYSERQFQRTRWRLTGAYLLISGAIIIVFSLAAFAAQRFALLSVETALERRAQENERQVVVRLLGRRLEEFDQAFTERLLVLNLFLFASAGMVSYFLSDATLRPWRRYTEQQEQFAAEASHELRTPLATILMEIVAMEKTDPRMPLKYRNLLHSVKEETQRMQHMVSSLLSEIRVSSDPALFRPESMDLLQVSRQTGQQMKPLADEKKITLLLPDKGPAIWISADPSQIKQLLMILLDNAIKYTPKEGQVSLQLTVAGRKAVVSVQDTGPGIDKAELSHIFERFYRVDRRKAETRGAGLGLAIARRITQQFDGQIKATSEVGKGSLFRCSFPLLGSS